MFNNARLRASTRGLGASLRAVRGNKTATKKPRRVRNKRADSSNAPRSVTDIQIRRGGAIPAVSGCVLTRIQFSARNHPDDHHRRSRRRRRLAHIIAPFSRSVSLGHIPANRIIYPSEERESRFPAIYFFGESASSNRNFRVIPPPRNLPKYYRDFLPTSSPSNDEKPMLNYIPPPSHPC